MTDQEQEEEEQHAKSTSVSSNNQTETTMPKVTTKTTNSSAQDELINRPLPPTNMEDEEYDDDDDQQEEEAQEDQTRENAVSVDPNDAPSTDTGRQVNEANYANHNENNTEDNHKANNDDHLQDESQQLISRRAHNSLASLGITKELRRLRDQRKKLFNSKGLTSRRRRRRKKSTEEQEEQKKRTAANSKLIKSMQTRQGSISTTPASSNYVNLLASPSLTEPAGQSSPSSSISNAIKQHLPSFQLSSAVQKLLLSKLIGQQNQQQQTQKQPVGHFNQLTAPFAHFHDHQASGSLASVDSLASVGDVDLSGKQPDLNNNDIEDSRLSDLIDAFGHQQSSPSGDSINANFRLPSVAASAASVAPSEQQLRFQQPGKQLIPIEIIGIDPSVSNSILYGPSSQDLSSTSGSASGNGAETTPGEQAEQPLSDSSQVFASNGGHEDATSVSADQTNAGQEDDFEATHHRPPNSINEQLTRFQHPRQQPKPSSVFHIHHFHHTNPKVGENNQPETTSTPAEQAGGGGGGSGETSQATGEPSDQQADGIQESSGQQQGTPSDNDQNRQQVAVNERGELVYVSSEAPTNEQQQVVLVQAQQPGEAGEQPAGVNLVDQSRRVQPSWRHNRLAQQTANEHWQTLPSQVAAANEPPQRLISLQRGQPFSNMTSSSLPLPYNSRNSRHQQAVLARPASFQQANFAALNRKQRVFYTNLGQTISLVDNNNNNDHTGGHFDNLMGPNGTTRHVDEDPTRPGMLMVSYKPAVGQQEAYLNGSSLPEHYENPNSPYNQYDSHHQQQLRQQSAYNEGSESKPFQQIMQTNSRLLLNKHLMNAYQASLNKLRPPTANLTDLNATLNRVRSSNLANQPQVLFKSQTVPLISMNSSPGDQSYWPKMMNNSSLEDEDRRLLAKFNALQQQNGQRPRQQQPANLLLDNMSLIRHLQQASDKQATTSRVPPLGQNNSTRLKNDELIGLINTFKQQPLDANSTNEPARFELTSPSDARLTTSKAIRHNNHLASQQKKNNLTQIKDLNQISAAVDDLTTGGNRSQPVEEPSDQLADSTGFSNIAFAFIFIVSFLTLLLIAASMIYSRRRGSRRCSRLSIRANGNDGGGASGGQTTANRKPTRLSLGQRSKHFIRSMGPGEQMSIKSVNLDGTTSGSEISGSTLGKLKANRSSASGKLDTSTTNNNQLEAKWKLCSSSTAAKQQQQKPRLGTFNAVPSTPAECHQDHQSCNVGCSSGDIKTLNTKLQKASYLKSIMSQPNKRQAQQQVSGMSSNVGGKDKGKVGGGDDEEDDDGDDEDDTGVCSGQPVEQTTVASVHAAKPNKAVRSSASPSASTSALYNYRRAGLINNQTLIKSTNSTFTATPAAAHSAKSQLSAQRLQTGDVLMSTIHSIEEISTCSRPGSVRTLETRDKPTNQKMASDYIESRQSSIVGKKQAKDDHNHHHQTRGFKLNQSNKSALDGPPDLTHMKLQTRNL